MTSKQTFASAVLLSCLACASAKADVKPAAIFSDHMVLQQGMSVPVWGWADPGEQVTVSIGSQKQSVATRADGKWMVRLANLSGGGAMEMTIAGKNSIKISDVLVGEVWLGSGQSNMDFVVSKDLVKYPGKAQRFAGVINEEAEIAAANYPQIRMFTVRQRLSAEPLDELQGEWQVCTPENVPGFSAIGYFFSRDLQKAINRPIGFIKSAAGSSCAQAWVSRAELQGNAQLATLLEPFDRSVTAYQAALANPPAAAPAPATQPGGRAGGRGRGPGNPFTNVHNPSLLFNGMIKPLQPYAIKGVLWYQGESITEGLDLYPVVMDTLITSWRKQWASAGSAEAGQDPSTSSGQGFPFYFVQLAAQNANSNRAEVREAQAKSLRVPNTAMAVAMDIGEKSNVHPHNKQELAARLVRIALSRDYGQKMEYFGPMYETVVAEGNVARVRFSHAGTGLVAKGGELKWFEIAGEDGQFRPAIAKIDGQTVLVSAEGVTRPIAVRYAWHQWPEGANLYNADGLPAPSFRSNAN